MQLICLKVWKLHFLSKIEVLSYCEGDQRRKAKFPSSVLKVVQISPYYPCTDLTLVTAPGTHIVQVTARSPGPGLATLASV